MSVFPKSWNLLFDVSLEMLKTFALWLLFLYAILALRAVTQIPEKLDSIYSACSLAAIYTGFPQDAVHTNGVYTIELMTTPPKGN